jgi:hypothetical protein
LFPRRLLLRSSAALGVGVALMGGGPTRAKADTVSAARERLPSYGPNGTHWPSNTPTTGTVLNVACTWAAIRQAISGVTASQAAAGVVIRVAPGALPQGAVLRDLGSSSWTMNIVVTAANGWGTVTISGTITIRSVCGVTFDRLNGHHVRLIDCTRTNWSRSKLTLGLRIYAESQSVSECNAYEVVMPVSKADETDPFSYAATAPGSLSNCAWEGCYGAPVFRPSGSSAHLDTFQMFGTGFYRGLTVRDSILFGANNCALQIGGSSPDDPGAGTEFLVLDHSMVLSQQMSVQTRYSTPAGLSGTLSTQAINGTGEPWQMSAINSTYVLGSMHQTRWKVLSNAYTSHAAAVSGNPAQDGAWIHDPRLEKLTAAQLNAAVPMPSDTYLGSIWR